MDYSYFKHAMSLLDLGVTMKEVFENIKKDLIEKALFQEQYSLQELVYEMCEGYPGREISEYLNYEHLEQEGGGEGGSEYCYGVFRLGTKIYKAEYSYYSHNGHEFYNILDTIQEVKPVQKTITVYE